MIDVEGDPSPHHRAVIVANVDFQIASNPVPFRALNSSLAMSASVREAL